MCPESHTAGLCLSSLRRSQKTRAMAWNESYIAVRLIYNNKFRHWSISQLCKLYKLILWVSEYSYVCKLFLVSMHCVWLCVCVLHVLCVYVCVCVTCLCKRLCVCTNTIIYDYAIPQKMSSIYVYKHISSNNVCSVYGVHIYASETSVSC